MPRPDPVDLLELEAQRGNGVALACVTSPDSGN
jgi:hypothetical protein